MSGHTKEPWNVLDGIRISASIKNEIGGGSDSHCVALTNKLMGAEVAEANARRIVACVNACDGIPTEYLEGEPSHIESKRMLKYCVAWYKSDRDDLLAALEKIAAISTSHISDVHGNREFNAATISQIAKDAVARVATA